MTDSTPNRRRMRRGGWLALITVVALLALAGGAYAIGSASDTPAISMSAQRTTGVSATGMMTWARRHPDEPDWMRAHHTDLRWMRNHPDAWRWLRNHPDDWNLMRAHPDSWRPTPRVRSDNGSPWACYQQSERMHDGWPQGYQRR